MKLTARIVEGLAKEKVTGEHFEWDDDVPGLGIRMRSGGSKNWVFQYKLGAKQRRMTLGALSAIGLTKAQETAKDLHARVRLGVDPAATKAESKERAAETFKVVAGRFLKFKEPKISAAHHGELTRHLNVDSKPLHELPIRGVKRRHVAGLLSETRQARGDSTADHLRASLSSLFTWTLKEGLMGDEAANPVTYTHREKPAARDRVLTIAEMREVWEATANQDDDYNQIVRLLMFTLQRRDDIADLKRVKETDFNTNLITLPPTRTKNKLEHKVPMSDPVVAILKRRKRIAGRNLFFGIGKGGYSGWSKAKEKLDQRILNARQAKLGKKAQPMTWRLHDLRRTGDTMMNDILGIEPHVVEAILNHVSGAKTGKDGVAGVYNRAEYIAKKKAALATWAAFILAEVATSATLDNRPSEHQADVPTAAQEAIKRRGAGEPLAAIAKSYAVSISMISRL
jgi:integrase